MKSFSEIETTSKRASRAVGFSWGESEEIGKCVRLLELFGFPGIKSLNQYYQSRKKEKFNNTIQPENIKEILGVSNQPRIYENNDFAGVVTGLAWTQYGGEILFVESTISKGKGNLSLTGNLGKVMKESATISLEYIKSNAKIFDISDSIFNEYNFFSR